LREETVNQKQPQEELVTVNGYLPWKTGLIALFMSMGANYIFYITTEIISPSLSERYLHQNNSIFLTVFCLSIIMFAIIIAIFISRKKYGSIFQTIGVISWFLFHVIIGLIFAAIFHRYSSFLLTEDIVSVSLFCFNWVIYTFLSMNVKLILESKYINQKYDETITASTLYERYVNRSLLFVKMKFDAILGGTNYRRAMSTTTGNTSEEKFREIWQSDIRDALSACALMRNFSEKASSPAAVWATVYFLESDGNALPIKAEKFKDNISWFSTALDVSFQDKIKTADSSKGIVSWVLKRFAEGTIKENSDRPWKEYGDIVLREELPVEPAEFDSIPARSAIAMRLEYHNEVIGVLFIGSTVPGYFSERHVFPILAMSRLVVFSYTHHREHCPWHRRGWRDTKEDCLQHTDERRFIFNPGSYDSASFASIICKTPPKGFEKLEYDRILNDEYKERFELITSNLSRIDSVFLTGTFNGWKNDHISLDQKEGSTSWETSLNLPIGFYSYGYVVCFKDIDRQCNVFEPKGMLLRFDKEDEVFISSPTYVPAP
jgi:hypothetical protein